MFGRSCDCTHFLSFVLQSSRFSGVQKGVVLAIGPVEHCVKSSRGLLGLFRCLARFRFAAAVARLRVRSKAYARLFV